MHSPDETQSWCHGPGPSLWSLITEHVLRSELSKVRTALGDFLVDMYTEVHAEAEMWYQMWLESQRVGHLGSRAGTLRPPLADPPVIKELLRAEVKMLLQTLRERAVSGGRDGELLLLKYKPETVHYALGHHDSSYCTNPGDTEERSRPSSCSSISSCAEEEIEAVKDQLNVTDIEQVVEQLRSVFMEECDALNGMVQHIKTHIKLKCRSQSELEKPQPSLLELRELRGEIQMDLELYPSSLEASPSTSGKELTARLRLSARPKVSDDTAQELRSSLDLRPHPPPPVCHLDSRPRSYTKSSESSSPLNAPLVFRTQDQHRSTSLSRRPSSQLTSNQIVIKSGNHCVFSPGCNNADIHCGPHTSSTTTLRIKPARNSPVQGQNPLSHHNTHNSRVESDPSPQKEREDISVLRSNNRSFILSPIPGLRPLSAAGSYSNSTVDFRLGTGASGAQNVPKKSNYRRGEVPPAQGDSEKCERTNDRSSVLPDTGRPSDRKSENGIDRRRNEHLREVIVQEQFPGGLSSHYSESDRGQTGVSFSQPAPVQLCRKLLTCPKGRFTGTTSRTTKVHQTQTKPEFINTIFQPVPPSRVSS